MTTRLLPTPWGPLDAIVADLRRQGTDGAHVEAKTGAGKDLWKTVSAFANTSGGLIIIGLDERDGFAAVPLDARQVRDSIISGLTDQHPAVTPRPPFDIDIASVDGSSVVVVTVGALPSLQLPCYVVAQGVQAGSYERIGDGDHRLPAYAIYGAPKTQSPTPPHLDRPPAALSSVDGQPGRLPPPPCRTPIQAAPATAILFSERHLLEANRTPSLVDRQPVPGTTIQDLDQTLVERYLQRLAQEGRRAVDDHPSTDQALQRLGLLTVDTSELTLAGLLSLGHYPQRLFPQFVVTVAVFPSVDRDTGLGDDRLVDNQLVDGPIPRLVERGLDVVARNLRWPTAAAGLGGLSELEIPPRVIREALANALMHRDYSSWSMGTQVQVEVFPDRVEIINPGSIWGGRSLADLMRGGTHSRNALLANVLRDVTLPRTQEVVAENMGTGLSGMVREMARHGLPAPEFEPERTQFRVVLRRSVGSSSRVADSGPGVGGTAVPSLSQSDLTARVLELVTLSASGPLTSADLAATTGRPLSSVRRSLNLLVSQGLLGAWVRTSR